MPLSDRVWIPAATCRMRPATWTWKNSSIRSLNRARNLTCSSRGTPIVHHQVEQPVVEVQIGQLACEIAWPHIGSLGRGGCDCCVFAHPATIPTDPVTVSRLPVGRDLDDDDGAFRTGRSTLAHGPEEQPLERIAATRPQHQQVSLF